jgi:hypothetical protein
MAIAQSQDQKSIGLIERRHPSWSRQFGPAERHRMLREDSAAFRSVAVELVAIVTLGFTLIATAVAFIAFGG